MNPFVRLAALAAAGFVWFSGAVLFASEPSAVLSAVSFKAAATSEEKPELAAGNAVDGNFETRWSSQFNDPQAIEIDYGKKMSLRGLILKWEAAYASAYNVAAWMPEKDGTGKWEKIFEEKKGDGKTDNLLFASVETSKIRILGTKRATTWGYSLFEVIPVLSTEAPLSVSNIENTAHPARNTIDGSLETFWQGKGLDNQIEFEMKKISPTGGVFIRWGKIFSAAYQVQVSKDGRQFQTVFETKIGNGGLDKVYFEAVNAKKIRVQTQGELVEIREVFFKGADEELTPEKYFEVMTEEAPKGFYPRWVGKEQGYWTVIGVPGDDFESLLGEDASLEPFSGSFTVSPFVVMQSGVMQYGNSESSHSLEEGYLPIPSVHWRKDNIELVTTAFSAGPVGKTATYLRHSLTNHQDENAAGQFCAAIRPLQINPPWQAGGVSAISKIDYVKGPMAFRVNGKERIFLGSKPNATGVLDHSLGEITEKIRAGEIPTLQNAVDSKGLASGAWCYSFNLAPGETVSYDSAYPLNHATPDPNPRDFEKLKQETAVQWIEKLGRFDIRIPEKKYVDFFRSNLAYLLINQDGAALQPGSRYYERSWIRDGAISSQALLEGGLHEDVRKYLDWYTDFVEADGEVPAIISTLDGMRDRIREYDSQGEYIFSVLKYYQYSGDKEWLQAKYPVVKKALIYLEGLRKKRLAEFYKRPEQKKFYGLLPPSVSHEGYFPEPGKHSYWDNFWALRGWKDGQTIAEIVGDKEILPWMKDQELSLRRSVLESIEEVARFRKIDFIPGCAELGDFDATSTAIAISPGGEFRYLPQEKLKRTFNLYINDLRRRKSIGFSGAFTPYELRSMGALLLMGRKTEALEMLQFFPRFSHPTGWNHWAEVAFGNPRQAQYLGDMPHTWVGAEYIHSFRAMFVYEDEGRLHLGAGIDPAWLDQEGGVYVKLPTAYGEIEYTLTRMPGGKTKAMVRGTAKPPQGFVFYAPVSGEQKEFSELPTEVVMA